MLPSTLDILMKICLCGDSLTFEKVVDIYRNSVVDENTMGVKPNDAKFLSENINQRVNTVLQSYS